MLLMKLELKTSQMLIQESIINERSIANNNNLIQITSGEEKVCVVILLSLNINQTEYKSRLDLKQKLC